MLKLPEPEDDGLIIPEVGSWSADKHHFLRRYLDAFTTSMRDKRWDGLHYIDLFAGAGIERLAETRKLEWGSPLIAAQAKFRFARLHLCELDKVKCGALRELVVRFPQPEEPQILQGNSNTLVDAITSELPAKSLSLAFLDPYGLHLDFETVRALSRRRCDLILFFPDHLDALRNWEEYYFDQTHSNLDRVLGTKEWRVQLSTSNREHHATILRTLYQKQLGLLGYTHFEYERISRADGRDLYLLVFCCRDKAGGSIWRRTSRKKPGGQESFGW